MKAVSSTVAWLRSRKAPPASSKTLTATTATFAFVFLYMFNIQASMTSPMAPPMVTAMNTRLWLKRMWLQSHDPTNITQYMTTMAVRSMAANRRYIFPEPCP
jgi:hypothetical protein